MKNNRVLNVSAAAFVATVLLVACGGGSGGPTPTPTPTIAPTTTNASGTVVDDASNTPLSGVQVALESWVQAATPVPVATTNAQGQFSFSAANGHYLLVIGSNSASDTRATVHDNV